MEHVGIRTAQNVEIAFEVAGIGDRVIAALIDYFVLFSYVIAVSIALTDIGSLAVSVVMFLPYLLYFLLCEVFFEGQSIGKRARGLKVARLDGAPPTLGNYLLRWLLRPIDLDLTFGAAAFLTVLVNGQGQRLGDLAAGTTVVRIRPRVALRDTLFTDLDTAYTPTFPQADALDAADVATAKEVADTLLTARRSPATHQLGLRLKGILEHKMGVSSELPPYDFLRTVIQDYNHVKGRI